MSDRDRTAPPAPAPASTTMVETALADAAKAINVLGNLMAVASSAEYVQGLKNKITAALATLRADKELS